MTRFAAFAACLTLSFAGPPAFAQDGSAGSFAEAIPQIMAKLHAELAPVAEASGLTETALFARIDPLILAIFPEEPATDDWAFNMDFNNTTSVTDTGGPTDGRQPILADAADCAAASPEAGAVIDFRRIESGGMVGHQCTQVVYAGVAGTLRSRTYAEGADRHITSTYISVLDIESDPEAARAVLAPLEPANIALAREFADLAVEAGLRAVHEDVDAAGD